MPVLKPPLGTYTVKRGDSLWLIAQIQYGNGAYWREIAKANRLQNADLILVGQVLTLPGVASSPGTPTPGTWLATGASQGQSPARPVLYPALKYTLDSIPPAVAVVWPFEFKLTLKGEITLHRLGTIPDLTFGNAGVETKYFTLDRAGVTLQKEYSDELHKFLVNPKIEYNLYTQTVGLNFEFSGGNKFVSQKIGLGTTGFKYECKATDIEGQFDGYAFNGSVGYEIEVTQKNPLQAIPVTSYQPQSQPDWNRIAWEVAAGALAVGIVAQDILTVGVGIADNAIGFAAVGVMWQQGGY